MGALTSDVVGGRKVVRLACRILASPFKVPTDTVIFSRVSRNTRAMPANMKTLIDIKYTLEQFLHSDDPKITLRPLSHPPQRAPGR